MLHWLYRQVIFFKNPSIFWEVCKTHKNYTEMKPNSYDKQKTDYGLHTYGSQ